MASYRHASRQTIEIIRKRLPLTSSMDRKAIEQALENGYPFMVGGGLARRVWRAEVRRVLKELGFRRLPRQQVAKLWNGETRRERRVRHEARWARRK